MEFINSFTTLLIGKCELQKHNRNTVIRHRSILYIPHSDTKENSGCYLWKWWSPKCTKIQKRLKEGYDLKRAIQKDIEIKFSYFLPFVGFVRCSFQLALFRYKSNWASPFHKINRSWSQTAYWDANRKALRDNHIVSKKTNGILIQNVRWPRGVMKMNQRGCEYVTCPVQ